MKTFIKDSNMVREETFDLINFSKWERCNCIKCEQDEQAVYELIKQQAVVSDKYNKLKVLFNMGALQGILFIKAKL